MKTIYDYYGIDNRVATEGLNWDTSKAFTSDPLYKEMMKNVKLASKLANSGQYIDAHKCIVKTIAIVHTLKTKMNELPEPVKWYQKLFSYFTPIFSLIPKSEIDTFVMISNTIYVHTTTHVDEMSQSTKSKVKRSIQERLNNLLKYLNIISTAYLKAHKIHGSENRGTRGGISRLMPIMTEEINNNKN